jgi:hypothetical protein
MGILSLVTDDHHNVYARVHAISVSQESTNRCRGLLFALIVKKSNIHRPWERGLNTLINLTYSVVCVESGNVRVSQCVIGSPPCGGGCDFCWPTVSGRYDRRNELRSVRRATPLFYKWCHLKQ